MDLSVERYVILNDYLKIDEKILKLKTYSEKCHNLGLSNLPLSGWSNLSVNFLLWKLVKIYHLFLFAAVLRVVALS